MAEFTWSERLVKVLTGPALLYGWWHFSPDYWKFISTPLGLLTIGEIAWDVGYLLLLLPLGYMTISWLYEAASGRDSIWFWHPD